MTLLVGLAMAEVCSSYPTAGGLYYWSAKLAPAQRRRLVVVHRLVQLPRPGRGHRRHRLRRGVLPQRLAGPAVRLRRATPGHTILLFGADPAAARRCSNTFGVRLVALLNDVSVWWHVLGVLVIVGVLAFVPGAPPVGVVRLRPLRQQHRLGLDASTSALLGLLLAQYTFTGYDASAHMTEETQDAAVSRARAASSCRSWSRWSPAGCC